MSGATSEPRLTGGLTVSAFLHAGAVIALVAFRPGAPRPSGPVYKVNIIAAPSGERAAGVVREDPQPTPPAPAPIPKSTKSTVAPKKVAPNLKAKPIPAPKVATPTPAKATEKPKADVPAPTAGGGEKGGNGNDVATVVTNGIEFPYQPYVNNITRAILLQFHTSARLVAEVRFVIRRDGSVDPEGIRIVTSSRNYAFDQQAIGAVEAAAAAKAFGPLPPGFQEDILPVTFRFTPALLR